MIRNVILYTLTLALFLTLGCEEKKPEPKKKIVVNRDLADIQADGKLKVLTTYSSTSYFLYRGQPMGYEYEMLQRFAEHLGLEIEISISDNIDSMFAQLNKGEVDLVAHGLTITNDRKEEVQFTDYLYLTHQVLVQKKPDNWRKISWSKLQSSLLHDAIELIGDTVSIRQNSAYMQRLDNLSNEMGGKIYIDTLPGDLSTDKIIEMVVDGEIKYTVADNNIANINASYYPILDIDVPISFSQRLAWAVRKNSPELETAVNAWLKAFKKETIYYVIYNKYFENIRGYRNRGSSDYFSLNNNQISKYDKLIKKYAAEIDWDWRLLAALVYQESRFDPTANSWAGANGIMQVMPVTAKELGIEDRSDPEQSLKGGTKFLKILLERFSEIEDSVQRIKFSMASYNCGYSHVIDAQNLAKEENLDPNTWDNGVDEIILKLSDRKYYTHPVVRYGYVRGREPYNYVKDIFERYEQYKLFID